MQKIKLDIEALDVQTFQVTPDADTGSRGTVQAHQAPTLPVQDCFRSVFPTCGIYC
ncbi:hypothetical protein [Longimicrobium sp.]|jgi:hypothetical protein|uniref:hypothetical protein n=1 Tax=Longimicrobium sp. TaxID=2029185 RepID=UPI002ED93340